MYSITVDKPYSLLLGTNDNISCAYTYDCSRVVLTITDGGASLLLESKTVEPGEPSELQSVTLMPADVTLVPQLPEKVKVLSLNNSLIHYNDQAAMFNDIAAAMGKDATWTKHTMLGKPLSTHWDEGDGLGADGNPTAHSARTEWSASHQCGVFPQQYQEVGGLHPRILSESQCHHHRTPQLGL